MKSPWQQYTHQPDGSITLEGRPDIAIEVIEELLVDEISIDGMCGVY